MNKFFLIAVFFALLVSSEVVITALAADAFDICMADTATDGEAEKDSKEKSEEDSKVEILIIDKSEGEDALIKSRGHSEESHFSHLYPDLVTPPPQV